tara:strand:+ start:16163 stop:16345 length:183 start_codon:yes stop_codon:yes gene_type:complete
MNEIKDPIEAIRISQKMRSGEKVSRFKAYKYRKYLRELLKKEPQLLMELDYLIESTLETL